MQTPKVLVVEDDETIRSLLAFSLKRQGLQVETAQTGLEALELARKCEHAVILLDVNMPVMTGPQFIAAFRECAPDTIPTVIVMTAFDEFDIAEADRALIHTVVRKPFDVEVLAKTVRDRAFLHKANVARPPG